MAPPIDLQLFRADQGGDPEIVKKSQVRRFDDPTKVDKIVEIDTICRSSTRSIDDMRQKAALTGKSIATLRKAKKPADDLQAELKALKVEIKNGEKDLEAKISERSKLIKSIGNIVADDVPMGKTEHDNKLISKWGDVEKLDGETGLYHHHELLYMIGGYEPEKGTAVAGHRGYFLTGPGVELNMALQRIGIEFLSKKDYTSVQPPLFMKRELMEQTCQLSDFDEELYHVGGSEKSKEETKFLIATSEQPISTLHRNEIIPPKQLPIKYAGISSCFRREAGAHGKDAWGIFRVHQFEKIEQFVFTEPDKSWEEHEKMLKVSEEFNQLLGLPYRVVSIVSGDLNNSAAKKYDLEGYFPTLKRYMELVSCSNCTDYQSRAMNTKYGGSVANKKDSKERSKKFVHMLNSTLCATTRTICCILENYQTKEGVNIPKALQSYCGGKTFYPFVREKLHIKERGKASSQKKKSNGEKKNDKSN